MDKLRKCRNFGELYETIGREWFGNIAYILTIILIMAPIFAGVINLNMLNDFYSYNIGYMAYDYNYKCITLWFVVFSVMTFWTGIFLLGKIQMNRWGIKDFLKNIKQKQGWFLWWFILLIWTILPICFSVDPIGAIWGISQLADGYITHIYMLGVLGCVYMITDPLQKEKLIWIFIIITDILAIIMLAYQYDIPFICRFTAATGVSVYTNSNHYGYIIVMAYTAVIGMYYKEQLREKNILRRLLCVASMVINAYALMINDTLGAYLAIVFTAIVLLILWGVYIRGFKIMYVLPLIILGIFTILSFQGFITSKLGSTIGPSLVVFFQDLFKVSQKSEGYRHAGTDRIGLWIDTIKKIMENPILGYGPEIIVDRSNNYILWNTPHNEFLECAFFLGIPGLVMYLGGLIQLCINKCKTLRKLSENAVIAAGVVIGYLASSFFGVRKFNTVCYFFVFLALLIGSDNKKAESDRNNDSQ